MTLEITTTASCVPGAAAKCGDHCVSFVIPALNEEQHIGRCLESIRQLTLPANLEAEIIVVDNQSADRTAAIARGSGARVIEVAPGRPSIARNAGASVARGNWLAFVDADCELPRNWLERCTSELLRDTAAVAVGGAAAPPDRDSPWVMRAWHHLCHASAGSKIRHVRWLPTFNLLIRRDAFDQIGGFDETLTTCEDSALGYKLSELGRLIHDPCTHTFHLGESRTLAELFLREAWRTAGNVRLAIERPFDVSNWLSLLVPPCLVFAFVISLCGSAVSFALDWPLWPMLATLMIVMVAIVALVVRKSASWSPLLLFQQVIVYMAYLAGRTCGLFWSFRRVERR